MKVARVIQPGESPFLAAFRGEAFVLMPTHRDPTVDSPFASWPLDEEPIGHVDQSLGVYHPPFQELASQRITSAGRSTMGTTTDDSTTHDEQTKTDGQNTGSQADQSTEQTNTADAPAADEGDEADEGEGDEAGESSKGGVPETDGATAG